jgi:hypothetical protein
MKWRSFERPIDARKQLLVEGRTPEIFFREWVEAIGLNGQVEVRDYGSLTDLADFLKVFTSKKEFREIVTSVGIIRDAEDKPAQSAFQSVCSSLRVVGLTCPEVCGSFSSGQPRTGIFVLPDCERPGMLETLCWTSLEDEPKNEPELACVMAHLDCLGRANVQTRNPAKAKVWTYLSGRCEIDPLVGRAAQAKIWNWESAALRRLSDFIKLL